MIKKYQELYVAGHKTSSPELQDIWRQMCDAERVSVVHWLFERAVPDLLLATHVMRGEPKVWS